MRHRRPAARPLALLGSIAALLLAPAAAQAAAIPVTSSLDSGGGCTLRSAITAANNDATVGGSTCPAGSGADTITFSLPAGSTITLASALPFITGNLNVNGPGASALTIDGADSFQILRVQTGSTSSISGLTLTHGRCGLNCGQQGGAVLNIGNLTLNGVVVTDNVASATNPGTNFSEGGGIQNSAGATLDVVLSDISGNTVEATGGTGQNGASGGGIMNRGAVTIDRSTVSGNHAIGTAGAGGTTNAGGGGIDTRGSIASTRSTISGNTASGTGGTSNSGAGGGIGAANDPVNVSISLDRTTVEGNSVVGDAGNSQAGGVVGFGSNLTVTSSTIAGNSALNSANLTLGATSKTFKNTIISNPLGGGLNCAAPIATSLGFNIEDGGSCGFAQSTDHPNTDPMLATLADNGGPTQTMALLTGSPAIDQGLSNALETTDQRLLPRPSDFASIPNAPGGDGTDIGAFEAQAPAPPGTTTTPPPTTQPPATRKKCKKGRKLKKGKCVKKHKR